MTDDAIPPGHIAETVTSLEMFACPEPARHAPTLPPGCRIERVVRPTVAFYRFLYDTVGEPWMWGGRRRWTDAALAEWIQDDRTEIWLLGVDGQPGGFAELDRRADDDVELSYFGLLPDFVGRRLGPLLLRTAVHRAWAGLPRRFWVHTCDLDHPAALGLYRREGFVPFRTHVEIVPDPRATGHIPPHVQPHRPILT
ncbi:GNAT family N-acetyltransferase [Lichenibacterium minor]|uniref:GNAT family N-acetyltransferase n=1 Tax=Lichenibacterium minor TaxID=2316528 RepID=A0A4Q2U9B7_9HYPH|nr:GNAT family N-acetyltransferase [Lichenibacterium minor]RYC31761.1 GNAT family N-acetyltransferase [Lichenibacterium minor]